MKIVRHILTLAVSVNFAAAWSSQAVAQAPASGPLPAVAVNVPPSASTDPAALSAAAQADSLLEQVWQSLERLDSITARTRHQIDMFEHVFVGAGMYYQQGHGQQRLTRMELRSQSGDWTSAILELCDGHFLWTFRDLATGQTLTRIDLARLYKAMGDAAESRAADEQALRVRQQLAGGGQTVPSALQPAPLPPASGLPKLIGGLRQSFQFERVVAGRLGDLPVWTLEGSWRPEALLAAAPDQKDNIAAGRPLDLKKLSAQLPERVVLDVGQQDLFPHRIVYLRRAAKGESGAGQGGATGEYRALVVLEFYDVHINEQIDARQFTFQPPVGQQIDDATDAYLKSLHLVPAAK